MKLVPMAALRDASWFNTPDVHSAKVYHVIGQRGRPACGLQTLLVDETAKVAAQITPQARCQRNGCKQGWPEYRAKRLGTHAAQG